MTVQVFNASENELPKYETLYSAGMDVRADLSRVKDISDIKIFGGGQLLLASDTASKIDSILLEPNSRVLIPTGLFLGIPNGYEIQVRPRSGLALKQGITVLNTPGTIDSDYTNEVGVILINNSNQTVVIENGERIAQLVMNKVEQFDWQEVQSKTDLKKTDRKGGFGSTGTK